MASIAIDRTDGLSSATAIKGPVRVATTANIALTGLQTVDGVSLTAGDRVLVKDQTTASENGIYVVDTGPWRRAKDFAGNRDVKKGTQILVTSGTLYASSGWYVSTADPIVIGTTSIQFTQNILLNAAQLIALEAAAQASADAASASAGAASNSAAAAAASAAGVNLPSITVADAGGALVVNAGGTGYDIDHSPIALTELVGDGTTDDTAAFVAALAKAEATGIRKVVNRDPSKAFKLKRAEIADDIEIDLGGAKLVADFKGALQPNNCTNILKSLGGYATGTLTFTGAGTAAETITIGSKTYTLVASATTTANEVEIGATAADTAANLVAAINGEVGSGTVYGSATVPHPQVRASSSGAVVTMTAYAEGAAGNAIATTETSAACSFAGATLTGGKAPISITLRNVIIDGQNDGTATSGVGNGEPLVHFIGGKKVAFDNVVMTNGGNRDATAHTRLLEYTNAEILIDGAALVQINGGSLLSSAAEMLQIQSWDGSTVYQIIGTVFDKTRSYDATLNYSNSSFNAFNCSPSSYMIGPRAYNHVKSAFNIQHHGGTFINPYIDGVSDSNGMDFNEAGSFHFDGAKIINPVIKNVSAAAIRTGGSNVLIEGLDWEQCLYGVLVEGGAAGSPSSGAWLTTGDRALHNIEINRTLSRGSTTAGAASIKVTGASSALPIQLTVDGIKAKITTSSEDYGVDAKHCRLTAKGYHDAGSAALIRMEGAAALTGQDLVAAPVVGAGLHTILFDAATIESVMFDNVKRITALDGGFSDFRFLNGPTLSAPIRLNRSPTITTFSSTAYGYTRDSDLLGAQAYEAVTVDADFTLQPRTNGHYVEYSGAKTATRACTLGTDNVVEGDYFFIKNISTGGFNLNVSSLKLIASGQACMMVYQGSAWRHMSQSTL